MEIGLHISDFTWDGGAAELGFTQVHGTLIDVHEPGPLDLLAEQVIPAAAKF